VIADIPKGGHVHTHNSRPNAGKELSKIMASKYSNITFKGYRRENGRVGVRNHVLILPVDDISNAACEAVANNVKGTLAIPHAYGRLQFGEDLELHFRTIIGTGANPNVAAVVVIGIEPGWTKKIADGIRETGKPVAEFSIEQKGDFETIRALLGRQGIRAPASEYQREECSISELWVSTKCGESDTTTGLGSCPTVGNMYDKLLPEGITGFFGETSEITGAEHICQKRAINEEVGERWYKMWKAYQDDVIFAHQTDDLSDSQPTKGNIEGGLTTIEEKALGNLEKIGRTSQFIDILEPAEQPKSGNGLYFMDSSSAAAECVTLMAAGGAVIHTFPTGQGNVVGNPIVPVIKITANPRTVRTMSEHVDVDVSGILRREMTIDEAGDALIEMIRAHRQRPQHRGRSARSPGVLDDQALPRQ
jgi:(2R)-sulfolactate sulfo-lyase subunit beta